MWPFVQHWLVAARPLTLSSRAEEQAVWIAKVYLLFSILESAVLCVLSGTQLRVQYADCCGLLQGAGDHDLGRRGAGCREWNPALSRPATEAVSRRARYDKRGTRVRPLVLIPLPGLRLQELWPRRVVGELRIWPGMGGMLCRTNSEVRCFGIAVSGNSKVALHRSIWLVSRGS